MRTVAANPLKSQAYRNGALALVLAVAALGAAFGFEKLGGYNPCPLCLMQRYAYFAGIPLTFLALILLASGQRAAAATVMFLVSLAYLGNAGLGVYHAGAEWKYWPGPDTCGASGPGLTKSAGSLLKQLETTLVVRCDEAPWRFLGLSFAGWNVVVSMMLWITLQQAAFAAAAEAKVKT